MIVYTSNMTEQIRNIDARLLNLEPDKLCRAQASTLLALMRERIHVQGKAQDGGQIGTYSKGYMKTRQKHGRGSSTNVILSLTRQMENSMIIMPIANGYGIGYATNEDFQKARWCEERYNKKIFSPTQSERDTLNEIAEDFIKNNGILE